MPAQCYRPTAGCFAVGLTQRRSTPSENPISNSARGFASTPYLRQRWHAAPQLQFGQRFDAVTTISMARESDAESQTHVDEQTPLIRDEQSVEEQEQEQGHDQDQKVPEPRRASWYIWRTFWLILAALVLTVFIKGWVDAGGDVDVRIKPRSTHIPI